MTQGKKSGSYFWLLLSISFVCLFFMETVFRLFSGDQILTFIYLRIVVFDLVTALLTAFILSFFDFRHSRKVLLIFFFILAFYALFQLTCQNYLQRFFTIQDASYGVEKVMDFAGDFLLSVNPLHLIVFIPWLLMLIMLHKADYPRHPVKLLYLIGGCAMILLAHGGSIALLFVGNDPEQLNTPYTIYQYAEHSGEAIHQLGIFRFLARDIINYLNPHDTTVVVLPEETEETTDPVITDASRVIDDTEWSQLISQETSPDIQIIDQYLSNRSITPTNDQTGIFAGKNLILFMVEAFDYMAIDEELTPTLYKMVNEGWFFDNFYSPQYSCATGQSEFAALTSLVPEAGSCTINNYAANDYYESIFNLFNNENYYSSSYHNWTDQYYDRLTFHASLYSDHFYNYDELPFATIQGWQSDKDLVELALPHFSDQDQYFSFIITSSTHFPYDVDSTLGDRYLEQINAVHPDYPIEVKRYLSKAMELDKAMEYLLSTLEASGELDNTVIVLFGDHHPLRMDTANFALYSYGDTDRTSVYGQSRTPFVIYNSTLTAATYSEPMSTVDITPTLANLFDLNYDPRLYMGNDYFSAADKIVYFANGSWLNTAGYYNASQSKFETFTGQTTPDLTVLNEINDKIKNLFAISKLIYKTDYFRSRHDIVFPSLIE